MSTELAGLLNKRIRAHTVEGRTRVRRTYTGRVFAAGGQNRWIGRFNEIEVLDE